MICIFHYGIKLITYRTDIKVGKYKLIYIFLANDFQVVSIADIFLSNIRIADIFASNIRLIINRIETISTYIP